MDLTKVIFDDPVIHREKPLVTSRKKLCVIWDLDGVLADSDHRLHYIVHDRANPDWDSFHAHTLEDRPMEAGRIMFWAFDLFNLDQFICTARWNSNRKLTQRWLLENRIIPYKDLFMRTEGDDRPSHAVKLDQLRLIWDMGYEPLMAFEDNPETVAMYRMSGVTCFAADDRHWKPEMVAEIVREHRNSK